MGSPGGTIMLRPSTAPRWKRHTKMRRSDGRADGRTANAARARNSGSRPKLKSARPPDFTKIRLEIVIVASLPLKLGSANREADYQGTCLDRIADTCQLTS